MRHRGPSVALACAGHTDVGRDSTDLRRVLSAGTREQAARELVELALAGGSRDNVTAVVADVVPRRAEDYGR